jgi:hypothetical protein
MRYVLSTFLLMASVMTTGCLSSWTSRLTLPDRNTVVRGQLTFHSDFSLPAHHRLLDELVVLRKDLSSRLGLPNSDEPIQVYLFENADRFNGFMKIYHPEFPNRRSFFVETDTRLSVYAQWGDRAAEDLRHEVTHGYLHSTVPNLPLWLDEGLAEFHETPRNAQGLNRADLDHLRERLKHENWRPNLKRLERLDPDKAMSQNDYDEAWLWVHFLLQTNPEYAEILRAYLIDLRRDGIAASFYERLSTTISDPNAALFEHLQSLLTDTP